VREINGDIRAYPHCIMRRDVSLMIGGVPVAPACARWLRGTACCSKRLICQGRRRIRYRNVRLSLIQLADAGGSRIALEPVYQRPVSEPRCRSSGIELRKRPVVIKTFRAGTRNPSAKVLSLERDYMAPAVYQPGYLTGSRPPTRRGSCRLLDMEWLPGCALGVAG
jgi:hypothetical protein